MTRRYTPKARLAEAITRHLIFQFVLVTIASVLVIPIGFQLGFPLPEDALVSLAVLFLGIIIVAINTQRVLKHIFH